MRCERTLQHHVGIMDTILITPELVRGALELEPTGDGLRPHRLPARARAQARRAAADGGGAAVGGAAGPAHAGVGRRAGHAAHPRRLPGPAAAARRRLRPARRRSARRPRRDDGRAGPASRPGDGRRGDRARAGGHGPVRRTARARRRRWWSGSRTPRSPTSSPCAPTRRSPCRPGAPGVAAPRQLDQPRLERREPVDDLARPRGRGGWRRARQPGLRRQRDARPVRRPRAARHPRRPDQHQDRHQPRERAT